MISMKNKLVAKIFRLFADSPSSQSAARSESNKETSVCTEESYPTKRSGLSSFFVFFLPATCSGNDRSNRGTRPLPSSPPSKRWKMFSFSSKDRPLDYCNDVRTDKQSDSVDEVPKECIENAPQRNRNGCNGDENACASHDSVEFLYFLAEKSAFISADLFKFLQSSLPHIIKGDKWVLLYSTLKHGISLQTLFRKSADLPGPCLLIVGDMQGAIFGGLLDGPLNPSTKRKYQGSSQTFVFTTIYGAPRLFRPTGANRYYYLCMNNLLAFGGGGSFALCLEDDLLCGTSGPSETFGNLCLAHSPEFELKNVELWGFTYSSHYLP